METVSAGSGIRTTTTDWPQIVFVSAIAALVVLRVFIPVAVLAASPHGLPLLPAYHYAPLNGDSFAYYQALTNMFASFNGVFDGWIGVGSVGLLASFCAAAWVLWTGGVRWLAILLPALAISLILAVLVHDTASPTAGVIGWPLAWSLPLLPFPLLHFSLTPDYAFALGLTLSLIANAVTVIATARIGLRVSGRRSIGLAAAALYATWPIWVGLVAGEQAWQNGQWLIDVGLHLYTEPLSTALFVVSLALLLDPRASASVVVVAGLLVGFDTAVKLTNGFLAAALLILVVLRSGWRSGAIFGLGGFASVPIVVGYWPRGYARASFGNHVDGGLYQLRFLSTNARTSTIFTGVMLLILLPLALVGLAQIRGWFFRSILVVPIIVTIASYCAYYYTAQHPRFYYVVLPLVFVLQAAGAQMIWDRISGQGLARSRGRCRRSHAAGRKQTHGGQTRPEARNT